jgi:hypothetical protein
MKFRPYLCKRLIRGAADRHRRSGSAYYVGPGEAETPAGNGTQPVAKEDCHTVSRPVYRVSVYKSPFQCDSGLGDVVLLDADGCDHSGRLQVSLVVDALSRRLLAVWVA